MAIEEKRKKGAKRRRKWKRVLDQSAGKTEPAAAAAVHVHTYQVLAGSGQVIRLSSRVVWSGQVILSTSRVFGWGRFQVFFLKIALGTPLIFKIEWKFELRVLPFSSFFQNSGSIGTQVQTLLQEK
jgi:hypothetical protein